MRMPEGAHILEFSSDTSLCLLPLDFSLGDVFHGDLVAGDGVHCHCATVRGRLWQQHVRRTFNLAKGALCDIPEDCVLPELGRRKHVLQIGHDGRAGSQRWRSGG